MTSTARSTRGHVPRPVQNLRVTFWGVRGSMPIFPSPHEVEEFTRQVAVYTLMKALDTLQQRQAELNMPQTQISDLIGAPLSPASVEIFQHQIGLPELPIYGGETTCIEVQTSDGHELIFDGGSGIRHCGLDLCRRWDEKPDREIHLFGSHEHLDHRSGIQFSRFNFARPNPFKVNVYGSLPFLDGLDRILGLFSKQIFDKAHLDDPLDYRLMSAEYRGIELHNPRDVACAETTAPPWTIRDMNDPIQIGNTRVTAFPVYHGKTRCLAYKVEHNGKKFVFCTDHELRHGPDRNDPRQKKSFEAEERLVEQCMDADLAYFDGQYMLSEYKGLKGIGSTPPVPRMDWGHSCIEDAVSRAQQCRIKQTYIGHHDPDREWPEQVQMDRDLAALCQGTGQHIELAKGDMIIDI